MKQLSKIWHVLGGTLLCFSAAYASSDPTTFLGPTLKGRYTNTLNNYTAYSVLGEAGVKNFRLGGTLGWKLEQNQFFKFSAEYLWQDITYNFFSGDTNEWVNQGAVGAGYLYEFLGYSYEPHFDLNVYLTHAPNKSLSTKSGTYNNAGVMTPYVDQRHIAGSNGVGIVPAVSIAPWQNARAGLGLNYDNVRYDKNFAPSEDAYGLGGTFTFNQLLTKDVDLGLAAAVRQPFNNYTAGLTFANVPYFGKWVLGIDGEYTDGKNTLPNTWNVGLSASYFMDQRTASDPTNFKDKTVYKDQPVGDDLVKYTADPAVYMPQVLAIPDEGLTTCGVAPTLTGVAIPSISNTVFGSTVTSDAAPSFSPSSGLTYTITPSTPILGSNTLIINSATGVISAYNGGTDQSLTATATATNQCGQAVSSLDVTILYYQPPS